MSQDWTELYRPRTLKDVVGNPKAVKDLRDWADSWDAGVPKKRAVVLIGTPGVGKTSAALALANEYGWGLVEMNASDQRNADAIRSIALRGAFSDTFTDEGEFLSRKEGGRKLIVLDEADNLFGREDRGAVPAIAELIKRTKQPVILIVNDFYELSRKSSVIKSHTLQVRFYRPKAYTIKNVIKMISMDQGINISERALNLISEHASGDLRAAVRDLQSLALGAEEVSEIDTLVLGDRLVSKNMYDLMEDIVKGDSPAKARRTMMDVDELPETALLWLDENIPYEYRDPGDLVRAYERLSRADIYLGRVRRRQYYRFWSYANDMMTYGVTTAKHNKYRSRANFRFPSYLIKMSRSKGIRGTKRDLNSKLGTLTHNSRSEVNQCILPYFQHIYRVDRDFRIQMTSDLELDEDEVAYLLNDKVDSTAVKHVMSEVRKFQDFQAGDQVSMPIDRLISKVKPDEGQTEQNEGQKEEQKEEAPNQRSLFDF
jgi:replication factor C large subunit